MDDASTSDTGDARRRLVVQTLLGLAGVVALITALGVFFREPLTALATTLLDTFGLPGLFVGVVASDAFSFPVPQSAYFVVTIAAESSPVAVVSVASAASLLGGTIAYHIGPWVARAPLIGDRLQQLRSRGEQFFERWGFWAVAIAAVTPVPFPIGCWLAGLYEMPFGRFFAAILLRIPRFVVYYSVFTAGWVGAAAL